MSIVLKLDNEVFGSLVVKDIAYVKHTHSFWNCYCTYCERDTIVRGTDLYNGISVRCKKCFKRVFSRKEALEIVREHNDGCTKKSLQEKYECSSTAIYSAIKLIRDT